MIVHLLSYKNGSVLYLRMMGEGDKLGDPGRGKFRATTKPPIICQYITLSKPSSGCPMGWCRLANRPPTIPPSDNQYVALIRDGRNQVVSWMKKEEAGTHNTTLQEMCEGVNERWALVKKLGAHIVRFEDLVANPVSTIAGVYKYLGFEPDFQRMMRIYNNDPYRRNVVTPHSSFKDDLFHERWMSLSDNEQGEMLDIMGDTLKEQGYLL